MLKCGVWMSLVACIKRCGKSALSMLGVATSWTLLGMPGAALGQVPSLAVSGLPATPLVGEEFCVDVSLTNAGSVTGYGPYVVAVGGPFLKIDSVTFVDVSPSLEKIGDFGPSGELTNPITEQPISGVEGGAAWIVRYPTGSTEPGSPAFVLKACGVVEVGAVPEGPIPVSFAT